MTNRTMRVLNGWLRLNAEEKKAFILAFKDILELYQKDQEAFNKSTKQYVMKIDLGPLSDPCPCCGK